MEGKKKRRNQAKALRQLQKMEEELIESETVYPWRLNGYTMGKRIIKTRRLIEGL